MTAGTRNSQDIFATRFLRQMNSTPTNPITATTIQGKASPHAITKHISKRAPEHKGIHEPVYDGKGQSEDRQCAARS